ncbi:MAG TPA: TonB family protein [bacterium]|nr:TonB family protein [bacterium]
MRDATLRTCFALAILLHAAVFVLGSLGLSTRVEYGLRGQAAQAGEAPKARRPEEQVVSLEDFSDEAARVRPKARPVPAPEDPQAKGPAQSGTADRPSYLRNPPPPYPLEARLAKQQGRVTLRVSIDAEGNVTGVLLKASSGFPLLDEAALATVRDWKFKPARLGGVAISTETDIPVRFRLDP